jgi:hypothetical protein
MTVPRHEATLRPVLFTLDGMEAVEVRADLPYEATGGTLHFDLYLPPAQTRAARSGVVILVTGLPDAGFVARMGCKPKEMESYRQWARLIAASGLIAITYENGDPATDAVRLFDHVRAHATELGIDRERIGVWSCSANVPVALRLLAAEQSIRSAALCYGFMPDDPNFKIEAELLVVRAGRDEFAGLNTSIDRFVAAALERNWRLSLINYAEAPHSFDTVLDTERTRAIIARVLAFLKETLKK